MFRIKNVRNSTVGKPAPLLPNPQPSPPIPSRRVQPARPAVRKASAARTVRRDQDIRKDVAKKPEVQRRIVLQDKTGMRPKLNIKKPATVIVNEREPKADEQEAQKKEERVEMKESAVPLAQDNAVKIEQKSPEIEGAKVIQKEKEVRKGREREEQQQRQRRREQYLREKQSREKQEERNAEQLRLMMEKVNARRRAREEERRRAERQQPSLAGIVALSDPLAHVEMSEAVMDAQVSLILSMNFAGYPHQEALQRQLEELERINRSYLLVRTDPTNRLAKGLANFRVELFNRVGEMVMQAQRALGPTAAGLRVMESDGRDFPRLEGVEVTRGMAGHLGGLREGAGGGECAICLGEVERGARAYELDCGHGFHAGCLEEWLATSGSCPICRFNVKFG